MLGLWCCMWVLGLGGAPHFSTQTDTRAQHLQFHAAWSGLDAFCALGFPPSVLPPHFFAQNATRTQHLQFHGVWSDFALILWAPVFAQTGTRTQHLQFRAAWADCGVTLDFAPVPGCPSQFQAASSDPEVIAGPWPCAKARNCIAIEPGCAMGSTRPAKPKSHQLLISTPCFRNCALEPAALSSGMILT